MRHNHVIQYENIMLRPLAEEDIEALRTWRNDEENTRFLRKLPYITREAQRKWFQDYLLRQDEMCFVIEETQDINQLVGSLSLYDIKNNSCLYGKLLVGEKKAHGKHVGVNATSAAVKIAFEQIGLETVRLFVFADNEVAIKVYKAAGFEITEQHKADDGRIEFTMAMTREVSANE